MTKYTPLGYAVVMKNEIKEQATRRLNILGGQIKGLQKMVDEDKYCVEIINQSLAVKEALSSFEDLILENHLSTHVVEQIKGRHSQKAISEILSIYKLSRKKR